MSSMVLRESTFFHAKVLHIKVLERIPELPYSLHSHEFYEIAIVVSGKGIHRTLEAAEAIGPGSVLFIPPTVQHGYEKVDNLVLYNFIIGNGLPVQDKDATYGMTAILPASRDKCLSSKLSKPHLEQAIQLLETIKKESESPVFGKGTATMAYAHTLQLLVLLFRNKNGIPRYADKDLSRLSETLAFMRRNRNRALSLKQLIAVANMSPSSLNRFFREYTGYSPIEYHLRNRIMLSCILMGNPDSSIAMIAQQTGFNDTNYFSRQFRNIMGICPRDYRKNLKLDD